MKKAPSGEARGKGASSSSAPATETISKSAIPSPVLAPPLTSYAIFDLCVQRARNLVRLHEAAHGKPGKPELYTSDAHRAAIVLAVSALDAFVRDFVISRVRDHLANQTKSLPDQLTEQIKRFLKEDQLLDAARRGDLLDKVEKAFRADFERRSFQGTKNIEEMLRIAGYIDVFHEVALKAEVNEDSLRADLDRFTKRRHEIAHRGDLDLSKNPPTENVITKRDALDCIRIVCRIARTMHDLVPSQKT